METHGEATGVGWGDVGGVGGWSGSGDAFAKGEHDGGDDEDQHGFGLAVEQQADHGDDSAGEDDGAAAKAVGHDGGGDDEYHVDDGHEAEDGTQGPGAHAEPGGTEKRYEGLTAGGTGEEAAKGDEGEDGEIARAEKCNGDAPGGACWRGRGAFVGGAAAVGLGETQVGVDGGEEGGDADDVEGDAEAEVVGEEAADGGSDGDADPNRGLVGADQPGAVLGGWRYPRGR